MDRDSPNCDHGVISKIHDLDSPNRANSTDYEADYEYTPEYSTHRPNQYSPVASGGRRSPRSQGSSQNLSADMSRLGVYTSSDSSSQQSSNSSTSGVDYPFVDYYKKSKQGSYGMSPGFHDQIHGRSSFIISQPGHEEPGIPHTAFNPNDVEVEISIGISTVHKGWKRQRSELEMFDNLALSENAVRRAVSLLDSMAAESVQLAGRVRAASKCSKPSQQVKARESLQWAMNILMMLSDSADHLDNVCPYILRPNVSIVIDACMEALKDGLLRQDRSEQQLATLGRKMITAATYITEEILRQRKLLGEAPDPDHLSGFQLDLMDNSPE